MTPVGLTEAQDVRLSRDLSRRTGYVLGHTSAESQVSDTMLLSSHSLKLPAQLSRPLMIEAGPTCRVSSSSSNPWELGSVRVHLPLRCVPVD